MAHHIGERDNMLAVGRAPWHGLGVTLDTPPGSGREALELSGLDWQVVRTPLYLPDGKLAACQIEGREKCWVGNVREDTGELLGVVGGDYRILQNEQLGELFDPLIEDGTLTIETCGSLFNGRRVWMLGKFGATPDMPIANGDSVTKYLLLAHGHDGSFAVRFGFTPIRVVCHNTLSMACNSDASGLVRCLHTKGLKENLDTLREALVVAEQRFELTAEQYRHLAARGVSRVDLKRYATRVLQLDPEQERKWTAAETDNVRTIVAAAVEGRGNTGSNWWHAYNGVTEWLCWSKGRKVDNRVSDVWWGKSAAISESALKLAVEMAG